MKTNVNLTWFQKVLYYTAKLVGLTPFTLKDNEVRPVTFLGKAYTLTLIALTILRQCYFMRNTPYGTNSSVNLVLLILILLFGASTVSALYIFAFKSEKMIEVINRISAAEEELKTLGMEKRQRGNLMSIATNVFVLAMKCIEYGIASGLGGIFCIAIISAHVHNTNMILIFVHTMTRIRRCFESLNEKIWDISGPDHAVLSSDNPYASTIFVLARRLKTASDQDSTDVRLSTEDMRKMRKLHHELGSLVNTTIDLFATPIILVIGFFFSSSLFYCYRVYSSLSSSESLVKDITIFVSLLRTSIPAVMVVVLDSMLIAHACSSTCDACNATAVEIHKVWNKFYPETLRNEVSLVIPNKFNPS